jgi:hypothetical protein
VLFRSIAVLALLSAAPAAAAILDFEDLPTGNAANGFAEKGYTFTNAYGRAFGIITSSGTNAVFPPGFSGQPPFFPPSFAMARADGAAFTLNSLVVFTADSNGLGVPISFTGTTATGSTVFYMAMTPNFASTVPVADTRTVIVLPSTFTNLAQVRWSQGAEYHQFDDIDVSVAGVPEPASWAQMLAGFLGLGAAGRRRRLAAA